MMDKNTPGPWAIDFCFETGIAIRSVVDGHMDKIVCEVWPQRDSIPPGMDMTTDEVAVANATLLVSAPKVLENLQCAVKYWRWWVEDHPNMVGPTERDDLAAAEAAIAKATGQ